METYLGGCHCGRVRFRVTGELSAVTQCNCSMCSMVGFLHLIVPHDQFALLQGAEDLTLYRFNTGVAQHSFCRHCGVKPFYVPRSDPDKYSVNARCLDGVDPATFAPHSFDGRHWEEAMAKEVPWR